MENWIEEKDKLYKAMESMVKYKDAWYYDMLDDFFDIETEEDFKEFLLKWLHHFLEEFIPIPDGNYKIYYKNGNLEYECNVVNGLREGTAVGYDKKGNVVRTVLYEKGKQK